MKIINLGHPGPNSRSCGHTYQQLSKLQFLSTLDQLGKWLLITMIIV